MLSQQGWFLCVSARDVAVITGRSRARLLPGRSSSQSPSMLCSSGQRRSGGAAAGMLSAKPTNVSAAHPVRAQHPQAVISSRQRRAHLPVIVHADDFGETVDITEGICVAIEAGVVTSTTVMVNMPGTAEALRRLPQLTRQASFGLHLNLCEGRPLTGGATLVDANGAFLRKRVLAARAVTG